ncbi:hypothetical protein U1839_17040 [Sphingomonas sp. RT2P30]|uniref:hypothetical protein n=1 Tax=Parasphingomonas halimpatiens TaxID=3096162 RepID=UPI002FCA5245
MGVRNWTFTGYIVFLAILSAICLASQTLTVIALFLIVPGLMLLAAPSLLGYSLVFALGLLWPGRWRWAAALMLTVAVGVIPPWFVNQPLVASAAALRGGDIAAPPVVDRPHSIALLFAAPAWRARDVDRLDCHQYCLRLLYGKAAATVLVGRPGDPADPLRNMTVVAYRIEQHDRCPAANLPKPDGWQQLGDEIDQGQPRAASALDTIRLRIAAGECLIRSPATLDAAELVIAEQPIALPDAGRAPRPMLQAQRVAAWRRTARGLAPIFRQTMTTTRPLIVPWIYSRDGEWLKDVGFLRTTRVVARYTLPEVMSGTFGYALSVAAPPSGSRWPLPDALLRGLADPTAPKDDPGLALTDQYLRAVAESGPADGDDVTALAKIIADPRLDAAQLFYLSRAIRRLGEAAAPLGAPLLDRLGDAPMPAGGDIVQVMARGIQALPPGAAKPLYPRLAALADDPARHEKAWAALTRLADAGPAALDRILAIAGIPAWADKNRGEQRVGGLIALCTLGADGSAAAPRIAAEIAVTPADRRDGGRYEMLWIILERQGAAAALVATLHPDDRTAQKIERWRRTARDPRRACSSVWV